MGAALWLHEKARLKGLKIKLDGHPRLGRRSQEGELAGRLRFSGMEAMQSSI